MTSPNTPTEHVGRGAVLAALTIPVGVVAWVLVSSFGIVVGILAFGIAFAAYWLYQRGAGGVITRTGAWVVTVIVIVTILLGIFCGITFDLASDLATLQGTSPWTELASPNFGNEFSQDFGKVFQANALFYVIALVIGALGSFRILRGAFRTTSARPTQAYPQAPTASPAQTTYRNDVDAPPTGSADDKTTPPTSGV